MMTVSVLALVAAVLLTSLIALPAAAQPVCVAETAGLVECVAEKLCLCRFERGGAMTSEPSGYRWDCGVLRPRCGGLLQSPATLDPYPYPLPPGLTLDSSTTNLTRVTGDHNKVRTGAKQGGGVPP